VEKLPTQCVPFIGRLRLLFGDAILIKAVEDDANMENNSQWWPFGNECQGSTSWLITTKVPFSYILSTDIHHLLSGDKMTVDVVDNQPLNMYMAVHFNVCCGKWP
jgi:hypothetical protein